METFRWTSAIVAILLGLGAARLLAGLVGVLRARRGAAVDWIPLLWAAAILLQQIAFWWSLPAAPLAVARWTPLAVLMLAGLTFSIVLAAVLVLPLPTRGDGGAPRAHFEGRGRWALVALAVFNVIAMAASDAFWHEGLLAEAVRLNLALTIIPIAGFLGPRRAQAAAALAYAAILAWASLDLSPFSS